MINLIQYRIINIANKDIKIILLNFERNTNL